MAEDIYMYSSNNMLLFDGDLDLAISQEEQSVCECPDEEQEQEQEQKQDESEEGEEGDDESCKNESEEDDNKSEECEKETEPYKEEAGCSCPQAEKCCGCSQVVLDCLIQAFNCETLEDFIDTLSCYENEEVEHIESVIRERYKIELFDFILKGLKSKYSGLGKQVKNICKRQRGVSCKSAK